MKAHGWEHWSLKAKLAWRLHVLLPYNRFHRLRGWLVTLWLKEWLRTHRL